MERLIRERIARTLLALESADILESEGGVAQVDVRLMNSSVREDILPMAEYIIINDRIRSCGEGGG